MEKGWIGSLGLADANYYIHSGETRPCSTQGLYSIACEKGQWEQYGKECVRICELSCFSRGRLFAALRTVPCQAPLSMGFSRQEYWSGLTYPPPGDLPHPGIELGSPALQADSLSPELPRKPKPLPVYHWLFVLLNICLQCLF